MAPNPENCHKKIKITIKPSVKVLIMPDGGVVGPFYDFKVDLKPVDLGNGYTLNTAAVARSAEAKLGVDLTNYAQRFIQTLLADSKTGWQDSQDTKHKMFDHTLEVDVSYKRDSCGKQIPDKADVKSSGGEGGFPGNPISAPQFPPIKPIPTPGPPPDAPLPRITWNGGGLPGSAGGPQITQGASA